MTENTLLTTETRAEFRKAVDENANLSAQLRKDSLSFSRLSEVPSRTVDGVVPVTFHRKCGRTEVVTSENTDDLIDRITAAAKLEGAEVIFTPEYSLFTTADKSEPIVLQDGAIIAGQETVVDTIQRAVSLAQTTHKTIALSTVCEQVTLQTGKEIALNTALIISQDGKITPRRKYGDMFSMIKTDSGWSNQVMDKLSPDENAELDKLVLGTVRNFIVTDKDGQQKSAAVIICHEVNQSAIYDRIPSDTDLVLVPISGNPGHLGGIHLDTSENRLSSFITINSIRSRMNFNTDEEPLLIAVNDERTEASAVVKFGKHGVEQAGVFKG